MFTAKVADNKALLKLLKTGKIAFHTYCPKWLGIKNLIIKGLPNLPLKEVTEDLKLQNVEVKSIHIPKKKGTAPDLNPI